MLLIMSCSNDMKNKSNDKPRNWIWWMLLKHIHDKWNWQSGILAEKSSFHKLRSHHFDKCINARQLTSCSTSDPLRRKSTLSTRWTIFSLSLSLSLYLPHCRITYTPTNTMKLMYLVCIFHPHHDNISHIPLILPKPGKLRNYNSNRVHNRLSD